MYESLLAQAFLDAVRAHPACAALTDTLQWRVLESPEELVLPAVNFSVRDVRPIGACAHCKATLEVYLEAQALDGGISPSQTAPAVKPKGGGNMQADRANQLNAALVDVETITASINAADPLQVQLSGYVLWSRKHSRRERRQATSLTVRLGFTPVF